MESDFEKAFLAPRGRSLEDRTWRDLQEAHLSLWGGSPLAPGAL
jgi:hypothetical protein